MQLSSGIITEVTEAVGDVDIEMANGARRGKGSGSIYLSDLWAWPGSDFPHEERDSVLRRICELCSTKLPELTVEESLHPTEIGLRLHDWICHSLKIPEDPPLLARSMCGSPFDAAVHDAVGNALEVSVFALYTDNIPLPSADFFFPEQGAATAISHVIQKPRRELPAWWIINKSDDLKSTLKEAFSRGGYYCFKLKITGADEAADARQTARVFQAARAAGITRPRLTVDSNEANADAESVRNYLELLQHEDGGAFKALEYLEQPTSRDILDAAFDWRQTAARKPVLLDEGLTDLSVMEIAKSQGWSGFALKTCKGHSMLLVAAAWAKENGLLISLQDLTNPGISLIHGALTGAHLPTINGAELNSPQFTPDANRYFLPRLSMLFTPAGGFHRLPETMPVGLGSRL